MKDESGERYPAYVPFHHRVFTKLRKVYRQGSLRLAETRAKGRTPQANGIVPDGEGVWFGNDKTALPNPKQINKSAIWIDDDLKDPEVARIVTEIEALKKNLHERGLRYTNTAATFLPRMYYPRSERDKLWECAWVVRNSQVASQHKVLDVGGASTPFSFYLASLGCEVAVLDNDWGNCGTLYNANYVARQMGWKLKALDRDAGKHFGFGDNTFDRAFSICVIEHLPSSVRQAMMREMGRVLKPGGILGLTMGYAHDFQDPCVDKGLRFGYRTKLQADLIEPSGLDLMGNRELIDYKNEKNFLGAIFLRKPGA